MHAVDLNGVNYVRERLDIRDPVDLRVRVFMYDSYFNVERDALDS